MDESIKKRLSSHFNKLHCTLWSVHSTVPPSLRVRLMQFLIVIIGYTLPWLIANGKNQKDTGFAVNKKYSRRSQAPTADYPTEKSHREKPEVRWDSTVYGPLKEMRFIKGRIGQVDMDGSF